MVGYLPVSGAAVKIQTHIEISSKSSIQADSPHFKKRELGLNQLLLLIRNIYKWSRSGSCLTGTGTK
jgi:hypothetical protein